MNAAAIAAPPGGSVAARGASPPDVTHRLRLYVTSGTAASARAVVNTREFCEVHLRGRYELEIVDISLHPERVAEGDILAVPTLLMLQPVPVRRFIGDMSQTERLLRGFGLGDAARRPA